MYLFVQCASMAKMHHKPWRTKGIHPKASRVVTKPGQIVSVDQLESPTPGFIAQLKGILTKQRYKYDTIFVDQYSRLSYIFLQQTIMSNETVQAKTVSERYSEERGVHILHYHADNRRFADKCFIENCQLNNQCLAYCGINAHFQNGIAEKKIWDIQEATRTFILFALHKWPCMLSIHLWPYAMRTTNEIMISTPTKDCDKSMQELFSGINVLPKIKHFHTFACPTYVLDNALQGQHYLPKWQKQAQLGIYLGQSPNHSRTVHLILNPRTGHVSPQYHVKHSDLFETITNKSSNFDLPEPTWKRLSGLVKNGHKKKSDSEGATSPTSIKNMTRLDDLNDINLPPDSDQDQRETSSDNQRETSPSHVCHQQETVLHDSEGETAMDTIPNPSVTMRSARNI